jgi:flagellar motor switch protein FliM
MSRVLSQDEVRALLEDAGSSAEPQQRPADEGGWAPFDFRRPDRIPKDKLRSTRFLHDRFCHELSIALSACLRAGVEVKLDAVESMVGRHWVSLLPDPTGLFVFNISLGGQIIVEIPSSVGFSFVDRLLGGPGGVPKLSRGFTEIEQSLLEDVVAVMSRELSEAWKQAGPVQMELVGRETRPALMSVGAPDEVLMILKFSLQLSLPSQAAEASGTIQIAVPAAVMEVVCAPLRREALDTRSRPPVAESDRSWIGSALARARVPLVAALRPRGTTAGDLLRLAPEHVLDLGRAVDEPIELSLGETVGFQGALVLAGERRAVEVTRARASVNG